MKDLAYIVWIISVITIMGILAYGANQYGISFVLGLLVGTVMTQIAVKVRYGEWF